ncbi:GxxExxY protein, partial [Candidatus Parcubacteria bacterium]|nr:GxxExxY protein [Candidatus Parcubacteria bacterium]
MADLIHKDLSYKLNGIFFEVQNKLGTQFQEKHYQKAICLLLEKNSIPFEAEVPIEVKFEGKTLGRFKADIVVDKKILLELKTADKLT